MAIKSTRIKVKSASKKKKVVNEITLVSEVSLGEAWNSKEDQRWDKLLKRKK